MPSVSAVVTSCLARRRLAAAATMMALLSTAIADSACGRPEAEDGCLAGPFGGACEESSPHCAAVQDVFFVNGRSADFSKACQQATAVATKLGTQTYLIWTDLSLPVVDDIAITWDKLFSADVSLNAATQVLINQIRARIQTGQDVTVICYSGGTIVTNNAVRQIAAELECQPDEQRLALLRRIHVLTVGSAVFDDGHPLADGWPAIGSLHNLFDERDPVSGVAGPGVWGQFDLHAHDFLEYVEHINCEMLKTSGTTKLQTPECDVPKSRGRR